MSKISLIRFAMFRELEIRPAESSVSYHPSYVSALENHLRALEPLLEVKTESLGFQVMLNARRGFKKRFSAPDRGDSTAADIDENFRLLSIDNDIG